jgi:hypothetical protein
MGKLKFKSYCLNHRIIANLFIIFFYRHLLRYSHETKKWVSLYNSRELQNYTMMKASNCGRVVCCGNINGKVFVTSVYREFQVNKKND